MASRSLGTLTLDLVARIGGFTSALTKAERDAQKRFKGIGNAAKKMGLALGAALAAAGTAAAVGIKSAIDYADKLNDMNQRLGVSAEALSGWGYAAKQSGTDIDALGIGLKKLAKNMAEALDPKSTQGKLFESLGVSITDAAGKLRSVEDVLPELATKFKELDNATLESALAMDLFGKSGTDLLEFLNQGGDGLAQFRDRARELGVELDGETLRAADAFNDKMNDLGTVFDGLFAQMASQLLPALDKTADKLVVMASDGDLARNAATLLSTALSVGVGALDAYNSAVDRTSIAIEAFIGFASNALQIQKNLMSLGFADGSIAGGFKGFAEVDRNKRAQLAALESDRALSLAGMSREQYNANFSGQFNLGLPGSTKPILPQSGFNFAADMAGRTTSNLEKNLGNFYDGDKPAKAKRKSSGGKSDAQREAEQLQAAYDRMSASLAEQTALFGTTGQAAKLRYELENGELAKLTQAQKDNLITQAEKLDQMERMKESQDAVIDALGKEKAAIEGVLASIDDEAFALKHGNDQLEIRNALLRAGVDANSEWGRSIIEGVKSIQRLREESQFMDGIRGTFNDFFMDVFTGTKSIKDAFKDLFDNIAQMITQKIVNGWLDKLFGAPGTTGAGSGGGDFFASLLGMFGFGGANANGNAFAGGNIVPFANGGVVSAPQFFPMGGSRMGLIGEAGPEAIMPLKRGADGKLGVRMSGGGGIIQNVYVQGRPDKSTLKQMERASGRGAAREMSRTGR